MKKWFTPERGVLLIGLYFFVVCVLGANRHSATYDEPIYIAAGFAASEYDDYRLKLDTPPLVPFLASAAASVWETEENSLVRGVLADGLRSENDLQHYAISSQFVHSAKDVPSLLSAARFPFVLIGLLGVGYAWLLGSKLTSPMGGLLAAAFLALDPTWQAHSSIVACDVPLASFFIMAVYHFIIYMESARWPHALGSIAGITLAFLSKFSAFLVFPMLLGLMFFYGQFNRDGLRKALLVLSCAVSAILIGSAVLYGGLSKVALYFVGYSFIYKNVPESNMYYLWGEFQAETWIYYYPLSLIMKLPMLHSLCIAGGIAVAMFRFTSWRVIMPVALPVAVVVGISLFDQTNYCVRRVLPAFPFLMICPAFIAMAGERLVSFWARFSPRICMGIIALALLANMVQFPNQLSSISLLFGGDRCGPYLLSDCNIDWGQDLPALADYQRKNGIDEIVLGYWGQGVPESYGVKARAMSGPELNSPRPAVYALSATILIYQQMEAEKVSNPKQNWLARFEPTDRVGGSIYIYDFREPGRVIER